MACGAAYSEEKADDEKLEKLLNEINTKLDAIMQYDKKLNTIIENEENIMQMLRIRRLHTGGPKLNVWQYVS
jgi:hypothetical protein